MSWRREQFKKAYNRAQSKQSAGEEYSDYNLIYGYWDNEPQYQNIFLPDWREPTMRDFVTGRLLTILSKLRIRGSKVVLDDWYW
jgi:hypothetical protein